MFTVQITTVSPSQSSWLPSLQQFDVEAALGLAHIKHDDLYSTPRPNRWQLESFGDAQSIARKMENTAGFSNVTFVQDCTPDNEPLALVTFTFETPDERDPFFLTDWSED